MIRQCKGEKLDEAEDFKCVFVFYYPQAFFYKRRGYCYRLRPSVLISPPKRLDEIQPNLVCELLT